MPDQKRRRESAEARFKRMWPEAEKAKAEYEEKAVTLRKRTARLKALREAQEQGAALDPPKGKN